VQPNLKKPYKYLQNPKVGFLLGQIFLESSLEAAFQAAGLRQ